jgi:outer membrane receptor protein involved in Fe transport
MSAGASYVYLKAIDLVSGDKIYNPLYPKNQAKGYIDIALDTNVHFYTDARMVEYYVQQGEPLWRYTVVDAKIAQKFGRRADAKGEIYFAMNNVFDRKYDSYRFFGNYPAAPREIRGGITIPF